ncbi:MAG TPA: phosphotransferase [Gammaproteobacteria bacterium]|nr:phosphotransferase [Gammaproteobacteria bacterium]
MRGEERLIDWIARELDGAAGTTLASGYQATVTLHDSPWGKLAVKRARHRGLFGAASLSREHEIYQRLSGISGIPKTYGKLGNAALVLEYVAGSSLRAARRSLHDQDEFFDRMLQTIDAMHAAGVAHCDLKRKDNTIVGPHETPYLVDFGVACILREGDGWAKRKWFALMRQMDYNAWVKLRFGRDPAQLPPEVAARYSPLWLERVARWIRIPWQKLTLRRLRKKWSKRR